MRGPKEKKERALGEHLHVKGARCSSPKCALVRRPYRPGAHGKRPVRSLSDFGRQIREKQKFKVSYGIDERNLRHIFLRAARKTGSTAERLIELLERRLDNVVFRLGLAPSRSMARQLVGHGHVLVNGARVRSPGFEVDEGDVITVRPESMGKSAFRNLKETLAQHELPSWLSLDVEKLQGTVKSVPREIQSPFEINLLVESFSK